MRGARRRGAGRTVAKLRFLRELDQLGDRFRRHLRIDDEHIRHGADQRDRREVLVEIELEVFMHFRCDEELRSHHQPGVAVGGARGDLRAERAGDTRTRIDHDPLVPRFVEPLRQNAGDDVRPRPRCAADDEPDGSFGVSVGLCGVYRCRERKRNQCCGKEFPSALHPPPEAASYAPMKSRLPISTPLCRMMLYAVVQ